MAASSTPSIKSTVSFGFSKKIETKRLDNSIAGEKNEDKNERPDFVLSVEEKEIKSSAPQLKVNKREYVIPLIKQNLWRNASQQPSTDTHTGTSQNDLDSLAARELMEEATRYNETWDERGKSDANLSIPLMMQNKVPDGFETDEKLNVTLRPDEPDDAVYDEIPVEQFGFAMLRGMGWKEGMGIGKNSKVIAPIEATLRPKGLGLGADRSQASSVAKKKEKRLEDTNENDLCIMKKGAHCVIVDGKHKDLYGIVEGIDEDNARVVVQLALSGQTVTVMQFCVRVVDAKEYEKYSKYLNKGKADKYRDEDKQQNGRDRQEKIIRDDDKKSHSNKRKSREAINDQSTRDSKKQQKCSMEVASKSRHHRSQSAVCVSTGKMWLCPNLRVRIVDKKFKGGRYYKEKVVVLDMVSADSAVCRTDDGKVLEGLTHSMVETVIPKSDESHVMVCHGSYKQHLAKLVQKNKDKCIALVQLLKDRDTVLEMEFDHICEYTGNVDEEFDY